MQLPDQWQPTGGQLIIVWVVGLLVSVAVFNAYEGYSDSTGIIVSILTLGACAFLTTLRKPPAASVSDAYDSMIAGSAAPRSRADSTFDTRGGDPTLDARELHPGMNVLTPKGHGKVLSTRDLVTLSLSEGPFAVCHVEVALEAGGTVAFRSNELTRLA